MKTCSKCGIKKPLTNEYFGNHKTTKDGFAGQCKTCIAERRKTYYEKERQWRKDNKDIVSKQRKKVRIKNKEQISKWKSDYYYRNKEQIAINDKEYYQENKEVYKMRTQKYRAKKEKLPCTLSIEEWNKILEDFNSSCAYCGMSENESLKEYKEKLHQEHFVPLSKGGGYTHNNIIVACKGCNSSKGDRDFFQWYKNYRYYDKGREQFILDYLNYKDKYIQQLSIL